MIDANKFVKLMKEVLFMERLIIVIKKMHKQIDTDKSLILSEE